ncbi:MAG: ABC transporter permease [Pseudomonadota bacterium]
MDESSELKDALNGHANTLRELTHIQSPAQIASRLGKMLLHMLFLGSLLILGLLKWMLLPPLPDGLRSTLPPQYLLQSHLPSKEPSALIAAIKPAEKPEFLKIPLKKPAFQSTFPINSAYPPKSAEAATPPTVQPHPSPSSPYLAQNNTASYWPWLKPVLILGEIIPFIFFFWHALRLYQISHRQRDWIMRLMGAHEHDIQRLLLYRAIILALGSIAIGLGGFSLLAHWRQEVPLLPDTVSWIISGIIMCLACCLSVMAYALPPSDKSAPML